tara:strand:+ start:1006 stop:1167 length:162 start_codon:yes stop_codon:yes gene_type:complete
MTYKLPSKNILGETPNTIIRKADNVTIPKDEANKDYQEYLEWVAEGNTPDPAD